MLVNIHYGAIRAWVTSVSRGPVAVILKERVVSWGLVINDDCSRVFNSRVFNRMPRS
jgi:hypothetical protein